MGQFETLAVGCEHHGVITHDVAAANGVNADAAGDALAGHAVPSVIGHRIQVDPASGGGIVGQTEGGAAGRVLLVAVMRLHDFDVIGLAQSGRGLLDHGEEQVHAQAHVGCPYHRDHLGGGVYGGGLLVGQPRGAEHKGLAGLAGGRDMCRHGGVEGEIDDDIGRAYDREVVADRDADGVDAGHLAGIAPDEGMADLLGGGANRHVCILSCVANDGLSHPSAGARNSDRCHTRSTPALARVRRKRSFRFSSMLHSGRR